MSRQYAEDEPYAEDDVDLYSPDECRAAIDRLRAVLKDAEDHFAGLWAEIEALRKERDDYKADRDEYDGHLGRRMAERDEARAELERARAALMDAMGERKALREAGEGTKDRLESANDPHSPGCASTQTWPHDKDCNCGCRAALARWREVAGPSIHPDAVAEGCVEC